MLICFGVGDGDRFLLEKSARLGWILLRSRYVLASLSWSSVMKVRLEGMIWKGIFVYLAGEAGQIS